MPFLFLCLFSGESKLLLPFMRFPILAGIDLYLFFAWVRRFFFEYSCYKLQVL